MDTLPWHLQLKIYNGIGIDACHALKIKPGKLIIPEALTELLNRSFTFFNRDLLFIDKNVKINWDYEITIPILNTTKIYKIFRPTDSDLDYYIKLLNHNYYELQNIFIHRNKEPFEFLKWAEQILLC